MQSNLEWVCNRFACLLVERERSLRESVTVQQTPYTAVAILIQVTTHNHDRNAWLRRINWQATIDLFSCCCVRMCVCMYITFLTVSISTIPIKSGLFPSLCARHWLSTVPLRMLKIPRAPFSQKRPYQPMPSERAKLTQRSNNTCVSNAPNASVKHAWGSKRCTAPVKHCNTVT